MLYHMTAPPVAAPDKQADELERLLKHSKTLTIQFVTVAGSYKPSRARLMLFAAPDRLAEQALRVMAVLCAGEDTAKPSAAVRPRPEWTQTAILLPTDPDAPPLDGALLDGWDSAFLSVIYRPGRVLGRLLHCPEDAERVLGLELAGWQVIVRPNSFQRAMYTAGRPWNGVPSFRPVPGGVTATSTLGSALVEREVPKTIDAPAPIQHEVRAALTESNTGFVLGATSDGRTVRLARRAMTLALSGSHDARQRAVHALLQSGLQSGMGVVVVVDRAFLPVDALHTHEARVRLLDVQHIAASSAIPWREIAPDLLAQAIGGSSASLPALPSRFGAVLGTLGAESLRVPAVLGLATMPGDDLRGVLNAGGVVVVPQDGDAASLVVARLLMAYLATPPAIGRGLLVLSDPAIVLPEALRQQAIQVVVGERSDALLRLVHTDLGWKLCAPDGSLVVELLSDLLAQPLEDTGGLVEIVQDVGVATMPMPALADTTAAEGLADGWWAASERTDDLDLADQLIESAEVLPQARSGVVPLAVEADTAQISSLDNALGCLLHALLADVPTNTNDELIQAAVAAGDFAAADALAAVWVTDTPQLARPWMWLVVLAEAEADRTVAAWRAIQIAPAGEHTALVRGVLDAVDAAKPAAPVAEPLIVTQIPATNNAGLSDDAIRAAWQLGRSVPQLVAQLTAAGFAVAVARARVRTIVQAHGAAMPLVQLPESSLSVA